MSATQVLRNYEALSVIMEEMRQAATEERWETLVDLEQQSRLLVEAMKPLDATTALDVDAKQRKIALIKKILNDDADIRNRTQTWLKQLQCLMQSNKRELQLHQTYGI